jgi:hypothetical protein
MTKAKLNNNRRVNKIQKLTLRSLSEAEEVATRSWMRTENPARSGDAKPICWMTKSRDDFYHEDYRSVPGQYQIIVEALTLFGDVLRQAAENPKNRWERNVRTYIEAVQDDALDEVQVKDNRTDGPLDIASVLKEMDSREGKMDGDQEPWVCGSDGLEGEAGADKDEEEEYEPSEEPTGGRVLYPRCKKFFYGSCLAGMRLWHRPPHNHCERCAAYEKAGHRITELNKALLSSSADAEHAAHKAIIERAGGTQAGWVEVRKLITKLPDLKKHSDWKEETRPFLKKREKGMAANETLWQLDYGGLNDNPTRR